MKKIKGHIQERRKKKNRRKTILKVKTRRTANYLACALGDMDFKVSPSLGVFGPSGVSGQ